MSRIRNYRNRASSSDDEAEEHAKSTNNSSASKQTILSFENEEDDEPEFVLKKNSRLELELKSIKNRKKDHRVSKLIEKDFVTSTVKLKKNIEQSKPVLLDEVEKVKEKKPQVTADVIADRFKNMSKSNLIPDAKMIHMARKQRAMAKIHAECGEHRTPFISESTLKAEELKQNTPKPEEEDDFSGPMFVPMKNLKINSKSIEQANFCTTKSTKHRPRLTDSEMKKLQEEFLDSDKESFSDEIKKKDHNTAEIDDWELNQMKNAMNLMDRKLKVEKNSEYSESNDAPPKSMPVKREPIMKPSEANLTSIKNALLLRFNDLVDKADENKKRIDSITDELIMKKQLICELKNKLPALAEKYSFHHEYKIYIEDLIECFSEKIVRIEFIEKRIIQMSREKNEKVIRRRRQDIKDNSEIISMGLPGSKTDKQNQEKIGIRLAEREARKRRREKNKLSENTPSLFQTFGQTCPVMGGIKFTSKIGLQEEYNQCQHSDGLSTDDEETNADLLHRNSSISDYVKTSLEIFNDVEDEFYDIQIILNKFNQWRKTEPKTYFEANIGLCLSYLLTPLIRYSLLDWNPLLIENHQVSKLSETSWFKLLANYYIDYSSFKRSRLNSDGESDHEGSDNENTQEINPDLQIIPIIMEKVIVQKLDVLVEYTWDPMSMSQSNRLILSLSELNSRYPTFSRKSQDVKNLAVTIVKKIKDTIENEIFIPLYAPEMLSNQKSPAYKFLHRQLNSATKLLHLILSLNGFISLECIAKLSTELLLNRYILVGLASIMSVCFPPQSIKNSASFMVASDETVTGYFSQIAGRLSSIVEHFPADVLRYQISLNGKQSSSKPQNCSHQLSRFIEQLIEKFNDEMKKTTPSSELSRRKYIYEKIKTTRDKLRKKRHNPAA